MSNKVSHAHDIFSDNKFLRFRHVWQWKNFPEWVYSCTYRESKKQWGLSDTGIANKKHFEEVIAVKKYVLAYDRYTR